MHFEILVEDRSGKKTLEILIPKIIGYNHTFTLHAFKGIGHIPKDLHRTPDPKKHFLLDQLPKLLRGYGKTFINYPGNYKTVVIIVCDLDDKCLKLFRRELLHVLNKCNPKPETRFLIAIEEIEAWLLGDLSAIRSAYPKVKEEVLRTYINDSICGTWEKIADAIYPGGSKKLIKQGWQSIGKEKFIWSENITPHMDIELNNSPSFQYFRDKIRNLIES